jgi:hypothetical protein
VLAACTGAETARLEDAANEAGWLGVDRLAGCAGGALDENSSIGEVSLRRRGIAAAVDATGRLDAASAREGPEDSVARPIAKEQANSAHRAATAMGRRRSMRVPAAPAPNPSSSSMRVVFMRTDTSSA